MGEIYIIGGIWLRQAKTKHKLLKHLNQDIRESRNRKCQLGIDKFTSPYKTFWNDKNYGIQYWNCNRKDDYEDYELKEKTILKKLKNGRASGEDNIPSEIHKYVYRKFKTRLLKFLNEI
jgi:hypothetical protein